MKKFKLSLILTTTLFALSTDFVSADSTEAEGLPEKESTEKNVGQVDAAIEFSKSFPKKCQMETTDFNQNLDCIQTYFILGGHPIHPMIIKDLSTSLSDSGDQVVAISLLDSQKSNKYEASRYEVTKDKEGNFFSVKTTPESDQEQVFEYRIEGLTKSGLFVLKTTTSGGGGSGIFSSLLFVRISQDVGFSDVKDDQLKLDRKRIVIEKLGEMPLEDRVKTTTKIEGDILTIETEDPLKPETKTTQKVTLSMEEKK